MGERSYHHRGPYWEIWTEEDSNKGWGDWGVYHKTAIRKRSKPMATMIVPIVHKLSCALCDETEDLRLMSMSVDGKQFGWVTSCEEHVHKTCDAVSLLVDSSRAS